MTGTTSAALAALGLVIGFAVLAHHPEPEAEEPDADFKPSYRSVVSGPFVAVVLAVGSICWWLAQRTSTASLWAWIGYGSIALVLVGCDALTTWLPGRLMLASTAAIASGLLIGALTTNSFGLLGQAALGSLAAGLFFWLLWRFSASLGFGDVQLAFLTGAVAGTGGLSLWFASMLAGTACAAVWGIVVSIIRRRHPSPLGKAFAYGPGLWAGPWIALLLT